MDYELERVVQVKRKIVKSRSRQSKSGKSRVERESKNVKTNGNKKCGRK